jgi:SH3-like domain-containing protein
MTRRGLAAFLVVALLAMRGGGVGAAGSEGNEAGQAPDSSESEPESAPADDKGAGSGDAASRAAQGTATDHEPERGPVTNLPLPRYVSLKTSEGNARRGPSLTHRIDWVFTRRDMPLRITAEHEHWRRVEDADGLGGWVHYSLLSGVRTVLVTQAMAEFRALPDDQSVIVVQAEAGVIAHVLECAPDWCRLSVGGQKGWVRKSALWGVDRSEVFD